MKKFTSSFLAASAALSLMAVLCYADGAEKTIAFRTATAFEGAQRYLTMVSNGGLNAGSKDITDRQVFKLVDLNGGELAEGDSVQIKWAPEGTRPTYWNEGEGVVNRIGGKPDDACTFKVRLKDKAAAGAPQPIALQTASGKFIAITDRKAPLATTDTQDKAAVLEIIENPTVKATS